MAIPQEGLGCHTSWWRVLIYLKRRAVVGCEWSSWVLGSVIGSHRRTEKNYVEVLSFRPLNQRDIACRASKIHTEMTSEVKMGGGSSFQP
jgi:hypothetical protein